MTAAGGMSPEKDFFAQSGGYQVMLRVETKGKPLPQMWPRDC